MTDDRAGNRTGAGSDSSGMWRPPLRAAAVAAALVLGVAACGGGDGSPDGGEPTGSPTPPATTPAGTPSPTPSPTPEVVLLEIEISDGVADPPFERVRVDVGETVRIVVHSDEADEIHLHGYDRAAEIGPGMEGVIEFVADIPGLFELETHHSGLMLLQLEVR